MPRIARTLFAGLTALIVSLALPTAGLAAPAHAGASKTPTYTAKDSGKTVHPTKGHELRISLETGVDGNYHWHYTHKPNASIVKVIRKRVVADKHAPGVAGYGYHTIYLLKAVGTGTTNIRLVEYQNADKSSAVKHFRLTFHVK